MQFVVFASVFVTLSLICYLSPVPFLIDSFDAYIITCSRTCKICQL